MSSPNRIFWGDTHHNTYQHCRQEPPLDQVLDFARSHLDFYTGAYYTAIFTQYKLKNPDDAGKSGAVVGHAYEASEAGASDWQGIRVEAFKPDDCLKREWAEFQEVTRSQNAPGSFVVFPGYEWQGNASWGDHNVIHRHEGYDIETVFTLPELYERLRNIDALAIPHHTGYHAGMRAPLWNECNTELSPFAEIFSVHGCSETDEERPGLRRNPHMGPGVAGGTYREALLRGLHLGAVCSTDNWTNMPGHWGHGLMACLAPELTREALWEAFRARRVYGVTGDRIELSFSCNDNPMGSVLPSANRRSLQIDVRACDEIDRIEILRNEKVMHTYRHHDNWATPAAGVTSRFKLRTEVGWGPLLGELPMPERKWHGRLALQQGKFVTWSPCWTMRGQSIPQLDGETCHLDLISYQGTASQRTQQAVILEFEATPEDNLAIAFNGAAIQAPVNDLVKGSKLLWYPDETAAMVQELTGFDGSGDYRGDMLYHQSPKVKLHRIIPEAGYTAALTIEDDAPVGQGLVYRVRVEQRNGQRAWSSPIWISP